MKRPSSEGLDPSWEGLGVGARTRDRLTVAAGPRTLRTCGAFVFLFHVVAGGG